MSNVGDGADLKAKLALAFSGMALAVAVWQAVVAQQQHDLDTGKAQAILAVAGMRPSMGMIPARDRADFHGSGELIRFETVDRLLANNPTIILKNTGSGSIDAVRVEVAFIEGLIDSVDQRPQDDATRPTPWVLAPEMIEYTPAGKVEPGQEAEISLVRGLICQMLQAQAEDRSDRLHVGKFRVRCFARATGATAFDVARSEATLYLRFAWLPDGFPRARCQELAESMKPHVEIR